MVERGVEPESVLVAVDDSPLADEALEYAISHHPDSDITALHVVDMFAKSYTMSEGPGALSGEYWETLGAYAEDRAEAILEEARNLADEHGVTISTETETGRAARTIVDYAAEEDIDCITIGSHGRTGVTRILVGSVAEKVIRRAPCPVTVVR